MRIFAVIDTNVLVSALLKWDSIPDLVVKKEDIQIVIRGLIQQGIFLKPAKIEEVLPDDKDVVFYAVTMETRKENIAHLVTSNIRHFPVKPYVVTPRKFLNILELN